MGIQILELGLRTFGWFWMIGGIFAFRQAQMAELIDNALDALSEDTKEDRLINRFLFIGSILTFLSGLGLALLSQWTIIPVYLLVLSQLIYFAIKLRRYRLAKTPAERLEATVNQPTINAFIVSLVVAIAASLGVIYKILQ